ncbi:class I glutamine amidotransferase-like protein [Gilbertella persicaria]|uniref:class I glutamine amidotransferase-like protein n=1 Tax=Gilbertella persicaria TaxID=101096 RepID=UPI00221E7C18|nr:class I glutamine amidotransferase-like protein [Gilbertella persicaria]KAI8048323.1 class I glutamine amidotransferase-like protein [Gilbertella persicaria]
MTHTKLHLALLINDIPMEQVLKHAGDYFQQYKYLFEVASKQRNLDITWDVFDVVNRQEYPSFQDIQSGKYNALILTGSKHNAHDNDPWIVQLVEFVRKVQADYVDKVKLVGFCFGHQIMIRAAGGKTGRNPAGWEVGWVKIQLSKEGQEFFKTSKDSIRINQFHQDHVIQLPENYKTLGYTERNTPHHLTTSNNRQCLTIQGHPEFSRETMRTMIVARKATGVLKPEEADKFLHVLDNALPEMEDIWFAEKVLDFIMDNI